jgi:hypothetical protein
MACEEFWIAARPIDWTQRWTEQMAWWSGRACRWTRMAAKRHNLLLATSPPECLAFEHLFV